MSSGMRDVCPGVLYEDGHIRGGITPSAVICTRETLTTEGIDMFRPLATFALILAFAGSTFAATPLTTCGETVSDAVLVGDLDCTSGTGFAVTITPGGMLDLAGYRLTGPADFGTGESYKLSGGVFCMGDCTIVGGGGTIAGPASNVDDPSDSTGVHHQAPRRLWYCPWCDPGTSNAPATMRISDATISGWPNNGVMGRTVIIENSTIDGNGKVGVGSWDEMSMTNCTVTNNETGAHAVMRAEVQGSTFSGNGLGLYVSRKLELVGTSVTSSESFAFRGGKLILESSTLVDNCTAGVESCADIVSSRRPSISADSVCETSQRWNNDNHTSTWSVCLDDEP